MSARKYYDSGKKTTELAHLSSWFYASSLQSLNVSTRSYPSTTTSSFEIEYGIRFSSSVCVAKERTDLHTGYATAVKTLLRGRWHERRRVRARVTCGCVHVWAPHRTRKARPPKIQGLLARCRSRGLKPKHVPAGPSSEILRRASFRMTSLSRHRFFQRVYFEIAKEFWICSLSVHFLYCIPINYLLLIIQVPYYIFSNYIFNLRNVAKFT